MDPVRVGMADVGFLVLRLESRRAGHGRAMCPPMRAGAATHKGGIKSGPVLCRLYGIAGWSRSILYRRCPFLRDANRTRRRTPMLDLASIVLGTGGILLMAAYAALCDRV